MPQLYSLGAWVVTFSHQRMRKEWDWQARKKGDGGKGLRWDKQGKYSKDAIQNQASKPTEMSATTESANAVGEPLVGDEVDRMIAALSRATPGQIAALRAFFPDEGSNMVASAIVSAPPEKSKAPKPVKLAVPKTAKAVAPLLSPPS